MMKLSLEHVIFLCLCSCWTTQGWGLMSRGGLKRLQLPNNVDADNTNSELRLKRDDDQTQSLKQLTKRKHPRYTTIKQTSSGEDDSGAGSSTTGTKTGAVKERISRPQRRTTSTTTPGPITEFEDMFEEVTRPKKRTTVRHPLPGEHLPPGLRNSVDALVKKGFQHAAVVNGTADLLLNHIKSEINGMIDHKYKLQRKEEKLKLIEKEKMAALKEAERQRKLEEREEARKKALAAKEARRLERLEEKRLMMEAKRKGIKYTKDMFKTSTTEAPKSDNSSSSEDSSKEKVKGGSDVSTPVPGNAPPKPSGETAPSKPKVPKKPKIPVKPPMKKVFKNRKYNKANKLVTPEPQNAPPRYENETSAAGGGIDLSTTTLSSDNDTQTQQSPNRIDFDTFTKSKHREPKTTPQPKTTSTTTPTETTKQPDPQAATSIWFAKDDPNSKPVVTSTEKEVIQTTAKQESSTDSDMKQNIEAEAATLIDLVDIADKAAAAVVEAAKEVQAGESPKTGRDIEVSHVQAPRHFVPIGG